MTQTELQHQKRLGYRRWAAIAHSSWVKGGAIALTTALAALGVASTLTPAPLSASDHDDGDIDVRSRALSLTDLYVFREGDERPGASTEDLIFVMNTNPRSLARQQYFFSPNARYEFRLTRVANKNAPPTAVSDVIMRLEFSPPLANNRQRMTFTYIGAGGGQTVVTTTTDGNFLRTTALRDGNTPIVNTMNVRGRTVSLFAGLREDPFFFDVESFFRVRAALLGLGPAVGFRPATQALDFAKGYNVNTIVLRVPRSLLQGQTPTITTFDTWLSLRIRNPQTGQFEQTEQLARPGINEALLFTQNNLAAYNRLQPTTTLTPELQSVANEANQVLLSLGNTQARATALLNIFLPDVMRIDTTAPSGFNTTTANTLGAPIGGRRLKDDVVDTALQVLTGNLQATDNVSYEGYPGNPAQGHQPLSPQFPYLAPAN